MSDTQDMVIETAKEQKRRNAVVDFFVRLVREKPLGTACAVIVLVFLLAGIFAASLAPYGYNEQSLWDALQSSSSRHWLGTDNLGRDILSRVIYGAQISMIVGVVASTLSLVISVIIGLPSGYFGGKIDLVVQRFVDAWLCFPGLILLILAITIVGPGLWQVVFVLAITQGIGGARTVRGAVYGIRESVYLEGARAIGTPTTSILMRHVLPNVMAPLIVLLTTRMPGLILQESSLSFLGLGIPPPMPSWGGMLSGAGLAYMVRAPWMAIWPGVALSVVVYGMNMFGDALRDLLDPRLKGGLARYGRKMAKGIPGPAKK